MLRTKVTDKMAPHDTLEVDMPDLESDQAGTRHQRSLFRVYSVPHMLVILPIIVL